MNTGNISIKASVSGNTPGLKGEKGNGIKSTVLNDDYSLTFNYTNGTSDTTPPIRGQKGEKGDNGISPSITTSKSGKVTTITIKDATGTKVATINDGVDSQGDMLKSTYDKNSNGIVDNSEKVNGHTVESNVPANAKFTDTIYSHPINSGNKHIPTGGSSGQILKWEEDGTAKWDDSIEAHREGTELKVNNYKQLIKFTKDGKTEQKSYTGINFWKLYNTQTVNGVTLTQNDDGSILLNGTATADTFFRIILDETINEATTLSCDYKSGTISGASVYIRTRTSNNAIKYSIDVGPSTAPGIQLDRKTTENYYQEITVQKGAICSNILLEVMLLKGNYTGDTLPLFEPYVGATPSPNPDYPQKIKNVRGVENLLKLPDGTYESNGITAVIKDGVITLNGTATARSMITISLSTFKSGSYRIAANNEQTIGAADDSSDFAACRIAYTDGYVLRDCYLGKKNSSGNFTLSSDRNLNFIIRTAQGMTYNNFVIKPQLEEGPIAHNFVPNGSNYLQLKNVKKNLFDKNNLHFILGTVDVESITINNVGKSFYIKCKPNTTYTISRKIVGSRFVVGTTNGIPKQGEKVYDRVVNNAGSSITLTTSSNSNYLCVYYLLNSTENENNILDNIQIEEGSESTSYEQYQEKIINVDLKGNNLCSNKDKSVKDELLVENGKAKIYKKIKEVVLDGSENWIKSGGSNSSRFVASLEITNIMKTKTFNALCNYFTYNIEFDIAKFHLFNTNTDGTARFIAFGVDASTISDLTQWKAFLKSLYDSGNPVRVQYELAEPEVIDLGEIDFDLIENSTLTCEEESDMQIDYLTIDSNIFVQDSLDGSSSQKAPSIDAVNEIISKLEARIIALENKNV